MIDATGCGPPGACPQCQHPAARVHSRYWRHIAGLPVSSHRLIVRLRVRRFFCDQVRCPRRTFVERVTGMTEPRRRTWTAARSAMRSVAVELGGRPGARLCAKLRLYGRRRAVLGQLTAPPVAAPAPRILGIDEFAFRKGRPYGTLLVDILPAGGRAAMIAALARLPPGSRCTPAPRSPRTRHLTRWPSAACALAQAGGLAAGVLGDGVRGAAASQPAAWSWRRSAFSGPGPDPARPARWPTQLAPGTVRPPASCDDQGPQAAAAGGAQMEVDGEPAT
ncbi:hypothetical protein RKD27_000118 [Streptomyces sp. SAI-126]|uniref:transposase family protein n=1 Tax=Streptomyces sp. SAI-126 TaxID=3377732 RepID=UPI003C7CD01E